MREYEYTLKENGEYLEIFKTDLVLSGTKERAVKGHIDNVVLYINDYMNRYTKQPIEMGCGEEVSLFLGDYAIRKGICSNPNTMKKVAASIKKFYKSMAEHEIVSEEAFEQLSACMKENMDIWKQRCEAFLDEEEEWYTIGLQEENDEIVPIFIEDVVEAFFDEDPYWKQYYNFFSGEIVMVPAFVEEDDYSDEQVKLAQQVDLTENFIALPAREDLDTYSIMLDYMDQQEDEEYQAELAEAIHGPRALHDFKKVVQNYGEMGNYNAYYVDNVTFMVVTWCVENQIPCDSKIEEILDLIQEVKNGQ